MADLTAAKTILEQLGGEHFVAMTGAKDFVATEDSLTFKIGSNPNHVSHVRVTQTPGDLYAVTFFRRGKAPQSLTQMLCHILPQLLDGQLRTMDVASLGEANHERIGLRR